VLYHDVDVVFICFSIDNSQSLLNISERWIMEVEKECPNVPIVLVGNKKDIWKDIIKG
jgi:GTPase SAR1 family protein